MQHDSHADRRSAPDERTSLLDNSRPPSPATSVTGRFFEHVAEAIQEQDRARFTRELIRYTSFAWAIASCLCAGSITAFSLYAPLLQDRLDYSQYQVNTVSIVAEVALYLPVPLVGILCDRTGPGWSSLIAALLFGTGYFLAAAVYHAGSGGLPFWSMLVAFAFVGGGTCSMYLAAVSTCAKNFGRGKYKGFTLAAPIASFGLGGMWQSQVGEHLLYETLPSGETQVDVFRYFLFLGGLLLGVGIIGSVLLRVVDEGALVADAAEELTRSGLLTAGDRPPAPVDYGTLSRSSLADMRKSQIAEEKRLKAWLLRGETARFLADPCMWLLAAGFFLVSGPGETYINNLGTLIGTLYPGAHTTLPPTTPATHVSIVAVCSTVARILSGALSDALAPRAPPGQHRAAHPTTDEADLAASVASLDPLSASSASHATPKARVAVSRMALLLGATGVLAAGLVLLASGAVQGHAAARFWAVSAAVGVGYGAVFALVPIVVSCVWGVENFATNWGLVALAPAGGAALFSWAYAAVYQAGIGAAAALTEVVVKGSASDRCYGIVCYRVSAWAMAGAVVVAMALWGGAWVSWRRRGVVV